MKQLRLTLALFMLLGSAMAAARQDASIFSASEISSALITLNTGEIELARVVAAQAQAPALQTTAEAILERHSKLNRRTLALVDALKLDPAQTETSRELERRLEAHALALRALDGQALAQAFLRQQADLYHDTLGLIDDRLLPAADEQRLQALLKDTRATVAQELAQVGRLRETLVGTAAAPPPPQG